MLYNLGESFKKNCKLTNYFLLEKHQNLAQGQNLFPKIFHRHYIFYKTITQALKITEINMEKRLRMCESTQNSRVML